MQLLICNRQFSRHKQELKYFIIKNTLDLFVDDYHLSIEDYLQ